MTIALTAACRSLSPIAAGLWLTALTACSPPNSAETTTLPDPAVDPPAAIATTPTPTPTVPGDPFQKGLDKAASAVSLAESAQTTDDWNLVISQWQRAIGFLKAVPKSSPDAKAAQKLLPQYQRSLAQAQQRAKQQPGKVTAAKTSGDAGIPLIATESGSGDSSETPDSEAVNNLNTLNQQQIEFFTKQKKFAGNLQELSSSVAASTNNFTYQTIAPQPTQQAMSTAIAKQDKTPSYIGAVVVVKDAQNAATPVAIVCATAKPSKTPPAMPKIVGQDLQCPAGATRL